MLLPKKSITYPEALQKLESYCAYQDRCHWEVEQKLNEYHLIVEAREKIIIHLIEYNFLNEMRFAQSFARGKFNIKQWGKLKIIRELKQRKISEYNIKKGLQEINEIDYLNSFSSLSEKKWESLTNKTSLSTNKATAKAKQKFINYMQYRGWENHLIFDKLREFDL